MIGKKEINVMTCSKNELNEIFARLKQDFANRNPLHVLDCGRVYMPVVNVSTEAIKEKHYFESPIKIKKALWATIQAKLQVFESPFKLLQKWKKD